MLARLPSFLRGLICPGSKPLGLPHGPVSHGFHNHSSGRGRRIFHVQSCGYRIISPAIPKKLGIIRVGYASMFHHWYRLSNFRRKALFNGVQASRLHVAVAGRTCRRCGAVAFVGAGPEDENAGHEYARNEHAHDAANAIQFPQRSGQCDAGHAGYEDARDVSGEPIQRSDQERHLVPRELTGKYPTTVDGKRAQDVRYWRRQTLRF